MATPCGASVVQDNPAPQESGVQVCVHIFFPPYSTQTRDDSQGPSVPLHVTQSPSSGQSQLSPSDPAVVEPPEPPDGEPPVPEPPVPPVAPPPIPQGYVPFAQASINSSQGLASMQSSCSAVTFMAQALAHSDSARLAGAPQLVALASHRAAQLGANVEPPVP